MFSPTSYRTENKVLLHYAGKPFKDVRDIIAVYREDNTKYCVGDIQKSEYLSQNSD